MGFCLLAGGTASINLVCNAIVKMNLNLGFHVWQLDES